MARPRLTPLDYIQGYTACDKDAVGSAGLECECDKVNFCSAGRMVTMSIHSFSSRLLVLFHCHHFRCIACAGKRGWSNYRDWGM